MTLLLDTHAIAWWFFGDRRFAPGVRDLIERNTGAIYVSAVSAFEMAQKFRAGKWPEIVPLIEGFDRLIKAADFKTLDLTPQHAIRAWLLPGDHRDPFDRLLAAQALIEGLRVVSRDKELRVFGVEPIWK